MKGHFSGDMCRPTVSYQCSAHRSPAADGECACPKRAVDCIRRRDGQQDGDAAFCQITLNTRYYQCWQQDDLERTDVRVSFAASAGHDEVAEVVGGVRAPVGQALTADVARQ